MHFSGNLTHEAIAPFPASIHKAVDHLLRRRDSSFSLSRLESPHHRNYQHEMGIVADDGRDSPALPRSWSSMVGNPESDLLPYAQNSLE